VDSNNLAVVLIKEEDLASFWASLPTETQQGILSRNLHLKRHLVYR
jgi:hypothetical protein